MTRGVTRAAGLTGMVALLAAALPCAAATSAATNGASPRHAAKSRVTIESSDRLRGNGVTPFAPPLLDTAHFTFTAPGRASTARLDTVERAFRFTPSGQIGNRKALSLGVTSRVVAAAPDASRGAAPVETGAGTAAAYNVGLAVAWRGFAVTGGYSRLDAGLTSLGPNHRDAVDVGLGYRGKNWNTALQVAAESGSPLLLTPLERRYSVDLGGAYAVGPRLSLSGGVRYKLAPIAPSLLDPDRADQSVYLGTAFSF